MLPPPIMTKKVTTEFTAPTWPEWLEEASAKRQKMWVQRKTDNVWTATGDGKIGGSYNFSDQAAAEEYVAYITALAARLERGIISCVISDI